MEKIKVSNLTIELKKEDKKIIDNISFIINPGDVIQLKGKNGTGKSTLIQTIMLEKNRNLKINGEIHYKNRNILEYKKEKDVFSFRRNVSYIPQFDDYSGHYRMTVEDVIKDSITSYDGEKANLNEIKDLLRKLQIDSNEDFQFDFNSRPDQLSGGQKRILTFLANFIGRPGADIYIIDEPLNNLDVSNISKVTNLIKEMHLKHPNSSFLIITHNEQVDFINKTIELK